MAARPSRWIGGVVVATAAVLAAMGRPVICRCGRIALWHGSVRSPENSQQLLDWYSLSHLVHGLLFYLAAWAASRRWPWRARLVLAVMVEALWEVAENSPAIIDRYRATTLAWGYAGDSILNSLADIACMIVGFLLARRLPTVGSVALAIAAELVALWAIRDNLLLNIVMLVAPLDAIGAWQAG